MLGFYREMLNLCVNIHSILQRVSTALTYRGRCLLYDPPLISMCGCAVSIMSLDELVGILVRRSYQLSNGPFSDLGSDQLNASGRLN